MLKHKKELEKMGVTVFLPAFDSRPDLDSLGICEHNKALIEKADAVHIFWDQRSMGTVFDFGMCFALGIPVKLIYMETKTFKKVMEGYVEKYPIMWIERDE